MSLLLLTVTLRGYLISFAYCLSFSFPKRFRQTDNWTSLTRHHRCVIYIYHRNRKNRTTNYSLRWWFREKANILTVVFFTLSLDTQCAVVLCNWYKKWSQRISFSYLAYIWLRQSCFCKCKIYKVKTLKYDYIQIQNYQYLTEARKWFIFTSDFQWCYLTSQGSPAATQHVVSVESSSLIHVTFCDLFVLPW